MTHIMPHILGRQYWDVADYPEQISGQHFGCGSPHEAKDDWDPLLGAMNVPHSQRGTFASLQHETNAANHDGASEVKNSANEFTVKLDVRHFKPEEVEVKVDGHELFVHGKHEERSDEHGCISRDFTRRYTLPENAKMDQLASTLNPNGTLTITAPKEPPKPVVISDKAKKIPIRFEDVGTTLTNGYQ